MKITTMTALITPFRDDETINLEIVKMEVRRQMEAGNGIFACGTNGDFSSLTFGEKVALVETCMSEIRGKVPLIANAGCPSTWETVLLAREFAKIGVDAIAAITPYFISCTQEGLYRHYARVADEVDAPVYIYEIPARTGNTIDTETVARLAVHENIKGIKDSSGKVDRLKEFSLIVRERPGFQFYVGTDSLILQGLRLGASGCVSGLANVVPDWIRSLADSHERTDESGAEVIQNRINCLREALYAPGYPPAMVKRVMYLMDGTFGNNRLPALVPSVEVDTALKSVIDQFELRHRFYAQK